MSSPNKSAKSSATQWVARLAGHGLGVCVVATVAWLPFLNRYTLDALLGSLKNPAFSSAGMLSLGLHLGLSVCAWALLVILFEVITGRRQPARALLGAPRGTVMTETLIVFPVFLLLTFGIAQLAVNNIAGLVANAAAFEAGRTYWLWSAEAEASRRGVGYDLALDKAHAQAAAVLAPVVPGDFKMESGGIPEVARQTRGILMGTQKPAFSTDSGAKGMDDAATQVTRNNSVEASGMDKTFASAIGTDSWRRRSARQFTFAYLASDVQALDGGSEAGVRLVFQHHQAFPLVGAIFGDKRTVGGRSGYYSSIDRTFTMPTQIPPNPHQP